MRCMILRFAGIFLLAARFVTPAASEEAKPPALIYHPWTKFCSSGTCIVGMDVQSECGPVAAAMLIEKNGETKRTLRVVLPTGASMERGARISIDRSEPISRPIVRCDAHSCMAEHEAGAELVDQLKQGRTLVVEGVDTANSPIHLTIPLIDFASAYSGPHTEPKIVESIVSREEFQARKARCGSKP
jgi:invasion protein IalB